MELYKDLTWPEVVERAGGQESSQLPHPAQHTHTKPPKGLSESYCTQEIIQSNKYLIRVTNRMSGSFLCWGNEVKHEKSLQCSNASCLEGSFFPPVFPTWLFSVSSGTNARIIPTWKSLNYALASACTYGENKQTNKQTPHHKTNKKQTKIPPMHQCGTFLIDKNL